MDFERKQVSQRFAEAVTILFPNDRFGFTVEDNGSEGFWLTEWNIDAPVPTEAEVMAAIDAWEAAKPARLRQAAYLAESDGLAIRAQRLEWQGSPDAAAAKQAYLDKVAEIKARYPDTAPA